MPSLDFLTFFSRFSHEKTGEISHFSLTPIGGENEKNSLTTRKRNRLAMPTQAPSPKTAQARVLPRGRSDGGLSQLSSKSSLAVCSSGSMTGVDTRGKVK